LFLCGPPERIAAPSLRKKRNRKRPLHTRMPLIVHGAAVVEKNTTRHSHPLHTHTLPYVPLSPPPSWSARTIFLLCLPPLLTPCQGRATHSCSFDNKGATTTQGMRHEKKEKERASCNTRWKAKVPPYHCRLCLPWSANANNRPVLYPPKIRPLRHNLKSTTRHVGNVQRPPRWVR
jgi:hypothetical protein